MDRFSFFFAFYGLILGLAVTEVLKGFAGFARVRAIRKIDAQTALLAALIFVDICATWLDAWKSREDVTLDFAGLWAPVLLATAFYLAAAMVFPRDEAEFGRLADYYAERKTFVVGMLLVVEFLVNYTFREVFLRTYNTQPAVFWLFSLPYNLVIKAAFVALLMARGRRANVAILVVLLLLFMVPYWGVGAITDGIHARFDHP